jgi:hypothetical protein
MKKHNFLVIKHHDVNHDLQEIIDYYNSKKAKLGNKFYAKAFKQMKQLSNDFLLYEEKYHNVRCVGIQGFPYLIHYTVNQNNKTVLINAIICTHQNPDTHWGKR